jgi:hypothetical protein
LGKAVAAVEIFFVLTKGPTGFKRCTAENLNRPLKNCLVRFKFFFLVEPLFLCIIYTGGVVERVFAVGSTLVIVGTTVQFLDRKGDFIFFGYFFWGFLRRNAFI